MYHLAPMASQADRNLPPCSPLFNAFCEHHVYSLFRLAAFVSKLLKRRNAYPSYSNSLLPQGAKCQEGSWVTQRHRDWGQSQQGEEARCGLLTTKPPHPALLGEVLTIVALPLNSS